MLLFCKDISDIVTFHCFRISLSLAEGLALSVGVYTVARRTSKSAYVNIDTATNEEVSRKNNMMDKSTGEILMPSDIKLQQVWLFTFAESYWAGK